MRLLAGAALLLALSACAGSGAAPPPQDSAPPARPDASATPGPTPAAPTPESAAAAEGPRSIVSGTVTYASRIALTPEAVVQVELRDVSGLDAEAAVVARQVIRRPGQAPVAFRLEYDPSRIVPGHAYAVSARIVDRGQLQFVTDASVAVLADGSPRSVDITVVPVR